MTLEEYVRIEEEALREYTREVEPFLWKFEQFNIE